MAPDEIQFPIAYYDGWAFFLGPIAELSTTFFGGPSEVEMTGIRYGPLGLHHVLTLGAGVLPCLQNRGVPYDLPLFYGMRFDGCRLTYRFPRSSKCKIIEIKPRRSSPDWPYRGYPTLLPYVPMRIVRRSRCTAKRFAEYTWQGMKIGRTTLIVIVPPMPVGGVSMWGPTGDAARVQILFECDLKDEIVIASNQCD